MLLEFFTVCYVCMYLTMCQLSVQIMLFKACVLEINYFVCVCVYGVLRLGFGWLVFLLPLSFSHFCFSSQNGKNQCYPPAGTQ